MPPLLQYTDRKAAWVPQDEDQAYLASLLSDSDETQSVVRCSSRRQKDRSEANHPRDRRFAASFTSYGKGEADYVK